MNITHLGGENTVTGSCHLLQVNGLDILIDCGLAQGGDRVAEISSWPVNPGEIDYLFLTHAHIDHIGRVPELIRHGFKGEILCSLPTKALLIPMLTDALDFTDISHEKKASLLKRIDELSWGFEFGTAFHLKKGIRFKLGRAGHILGSCFIRFDLSDYRSVVFSGDLGGKNTPILCDPDLSESCDLLVLESTYGDRLHGDRTRRIERLGQILTRSLSDGGKVFIPCFALGRTQELLYEMDRLDITSRLNAPVYVDSPLGQELTLVYNSLAPYWDAESTALYRSGDHPFNFQKLYAVSNMQQHREIMEADGPMIILAGSGMCTGGRIVDHLRAGLEDARNDVLFVGYQAGGTLGRDLLRYGQRPGGYVAMDGRRCDIRARVHRLTGYSAHADRQGLVEWVRGMGDRPKEIRLVHGEEGAKRGLWASIAK
jgi:metallo-beta-lactamase family protein